MNSVTGSSPSSARIGAQLGRSHWPISPAMDVLWLMSGSLERGDMRNSACRSQECGRTAREERHRLRCRAVADHLSKAGRSRNMAAIRSRDTKPELALRRALWAAGVRGWRCHRRDLPGRPDLAFGRWRVAVQVDGAYWHGHPDHIRPGASPYWVEKIRRNQERDRASDAALAEAGWATVRMWDLDIAEDLDACVARVVAVLRDRGFTGAPGDDAA
jgi:DNA mismatch endonuclease (patch repair protein)